MDELIGIARGVLADGNFVIEEAHFLLDWLERNEPVRRNFFGKVLYDSLREALADDEMTAEEEDILVGLLLRFVGPITSAVKRSELFDGFATRPASAQTWILRSEAFALRGSSPLALAGIVRWQSWRGWSCSSIPYLRDALFGNR